MRVLCFIFAVSLLVSADDKKGHKHTHKHGHKSHDHGAAEVNLAVEGKKVDIEFHSPATAVVGFEYVPTSAADKKKQADALATLKANISKMIVFDAAAGCKITPKSVEVDQSEPDHAEIDADFTATCAQPPAGTKVSFGVSKIYPGIEKVKVQAIGSSGSTGAEISKDKGTVTLPK